jgi:hypothetical protein
MPFNKRDKNQDVLMAEIMSKEDQDPGLVKPEDFEIRGEDLVKKRRALKFTDVAGKSPLGQPTPDRNRAGGPPRKSKS